MATESPDQGGLINRLLRLLKGKEGVAPVIPSPLSESSKEASRQKKKSDKELAEEVVKQLERITPSHKANEIFEGVELSKNVLSQSGELRNLLFDIIYRSDTDTFGVAAYHKRDWLEATIKRAAIIKKNLRASQEDIGNLDKLEANLERLREQAEDHDRRINERKKEVDLAVRGEAVSSDAAFQQTIDLIKKDDTPESKALVEVVDSFGGVPKDIEHFKNIQHSFETQRSSMVKRVNQQDPKALERFVREYDHMRRAQEKLGRLFVERFPIEGRLHYIMQSEAGKQLEKAIHEDPDRMDYYFYKVLEPVLYNERLESHRDLYNLYTMGDMEAFLEIVSRKKDAQGRNVGRELVSYYTILKNTILQSHDMDYYAAHPMLDIKELMSSTAMFTNDFINFAHQDPLVALAKRAYEVALLQIREDHNGYIPREYLTWERGRMVSGLETRVEKIVKDAIKYGQLYHEKVDPVTGKPDTTRWGRVRIDDQRPYTLEELYGGQPEQSEDWRRQLGDLKLSAALKQAKGLALVDMRLLEIIGRSKGAGSNAASVEQNNYTFSAEGPFNSVPYEGIVRHIEPIVHHFTRWRIAREEYLPFFSMMITEKDHTWNEAKIRRLIELHLEGDHEKIREEFGEEADTRLLAVDNPFAFSGMWGTMTGWRIADTSVGWDDWEKEKYSTANKLMVTGNRFIKQGGRESGKHEINYAPGRAWKRVEEYFLYEDNDNKYQGKDGLTASQLHKRCKDTYQESLRNSRDWDLVRIAGNDDDFEVKWKTAGIKQKDPQSGKSYETLLKNHSKSVMKLHPKLEKEMAELEMKLERAYKARTWIQAAMRSPLVVARECKADYEIAGYKRNGPLRKKIIYELLGIDIDDFARIGTPTVEEKHTLDTVTDVEAAVFSIQQITLRENRDLKQEDFEILTQKAKTPQERQVAEYAFQYWSQVKNYMLGRITAENWYKKIGIEDADTNKPIGLRLHRINWKRINEISLHHKGEEKSIFENPEGFQSDLMNGKLVDRDWRYLFSTEDMGWEYLNIGALGPRNPMRRAGDLAAHVGFNQGLEDILVQILSGHLPKDDFIKKMKEMWVAMSGDAGDPATEACSRVFYTTLMLYRKFDWAWKIPWVGPAFAVVKPASVMQIIHGKIHGEAMGPNDLLQLIHMGEQARLFPAKVKSRLTDRFVYGSPPQPNWDAHIMEERLGATQNAAVYEMLTAAVLLSIALMIYRALTTKEEETIGGGGGHN